MRASRVSEPGIRAHPAPPDVVQKLEMPKMVAGHDPAFENAIRRIGV